MAALTREGMMGLIHTLCSSVGNIYLMQSAKELQSVAKVLARSTFFLTGCIGDHLPLPTLKTMLSFIHLTLRLYCNIVWGERGVCKIKYTVLKSKDSVMKCYSIQRAKYFATDCTSQHFASFLAKCKITFNVRKSTKY